MVLVLVPYAHALERGLVELISAIGERERAARAAYLRAIAPLLSYDPARPAGFAIAHPKACFCTNHLPKSHLSYLALLLEPPQKSSDVSSALCSSQALRNP